MKLPSEPGAISSQAGSFQLEAHACYRALLGDAHRQAPEPSLGGRLLYAGELDAPGRAMMVAGNVAGCATLAVAPDQAAQKQAIRDGAVDFAVTSLDEALRILKNEIRKRNSVGVCIGASRAGVEREMIARGVLPDFVFAGTADQRREVGCFGEQVREVVVAELSGNMAVLAWQAKQAPARWMPKLDDIALDCLVDEPWAQRWIRLSPRYFGRANLAARAFYCEQQRAIMVMRRFADAVEDGSIATEVSVSLTHASETKTSHLKPNAGSAPAD